MSAHSKSWGHTLRLLTAEEYERTNRGDYGCGMRRDGRRCGAPMTHAQRYSYVTGRAGRVSDSERAVCAEHADRFAKRWGLEVPAEPSERPHALRLRHDVEGVAR